MTRGVAARQQSGRVVGLCYHSIHPSTSFASATPALFERHLAWLSETCDLISVRQMLAAAQETDRVRPAVAITFDDGYADNHEFALPILKKYRAPATFFLTVGLIARDLTVCARFRKSRNATDLQALEWSQVLELHAEGMEIGSHTYSHPNLIRLDMSTVDRELRVSKQLLEDRLEQSIDLLAYPFGKPRRQFDETTIQIATSVGYSYAAAVLCRSVKAEDSPFALPRFFATRDSIGDLAAKVRGEWGLSGAWQERAPLCIARVISPADFRFR